MSDLAAVIPILIVTLSAIAAMVAEAFREPGERIPSGLGLIGLVGAIVASVFLWGRQTVAFEVVRADDFALFVNVVLAIIGILTILLSSEIVEREQIPAGEYYALLLFGLAGMMLMAAATDLLVIFIALEIFSLSVYVLTGIRRSSPTGAEASFKYFLLGAFSSAFFLYGIALTFAETGSTRLADLAPLIATQAMHPSVLALLGVGLLMVGFAFKVSAVPFHMWTPDAYQGAPTIVTGFMSTAVKAAAFAAFVRVFIPVFGPLSASWVPLLWWIAVLTMVVGTVVGVVQTNVKRMLAYSSIAHAGYILVGVIAAGLAGGDSESGMAAVLFYLLAYAVTNLGAFGVVALLATREHAHDELQGLHRAVVPAARPGRPDGRLPALARRLPADRRLHREVVHLQHRRAARPVRARHHRRAVERRVGLLLPAHHRDDVHDRPAGRGAARVGGAAGGHGRALARRRRDLLSRRAARAGARPRPAVGLRDAVTLRGLGARVLGTRGRA